MKDSSSVVLTVDNEAMGSDVPDWFSRATEAVLGATHATLACRAYDLSQEGSRQAFIQWQWDFNRKISKAHFGHEIA